MKSAATFVACIIALGSAQHPNRDAAKTDKATDANPQPTVTFVDNRKAAPEQNPAEQQSPNWYATSAPAEWVLVLVGIGAVCAAYRTLKAIEGQLAEMKGQREQMGKQVEAAVLQVRAMQEQITEMSQQTEQSKRLLEIENKTLILQYRPKIIVRNAQALSFSFDLGMPWECEIRFQITNTGGSTAYISAGSHIQLGSVIANDIGKIEIKWGDQCPVSPVTLGPGQGITVEDFAATGAMFNLEWENFRQGLEAPPRRYLVLTGVIYYTDDLNIPRSSGISRDFESKTSIFTPKRESELEYSD
jgi:hypothetical protein